MIIFSPVSQKGGVGKTNTSYNHAFFAEDEGLRSLLADFDDQGNATSVMQEHVIADFTTADLFRRKPLPLPSKFKNLTVIPCNKARLKEIELSGMEDEEMVENLQARLIELAPHFDILTCDTPGSNSRIANAALAVSDYVVIPCKIDPFSIEVTTEVLMRVMYIQENFNPNLVNFGIMANEYDPRQPAQVRELKKLLGEYHEYMFPKCITDRQAYREAAGARVPVWRFKKQIEGETRARIKSATRDAGVEMRSVFRLMHERIKADIQKAREAA